MRAFSRTTSGDAGASRETQASPDAVFMKVWGLTPEAWAALSDAERVHHRLHVMHAPYLNGDAQASR